MIILLRTLFEQNQSNMLIEYIMEQMVQLYKQLTSCERLKTNVFFHIVMTQPIFVEIDEKNKIKGAITILLEQKIIHNGGYVCHIEDLVVDKEYRGQNIGKKLVQYAIQHAKDHNCYKTILNCDVDLEPFYGSLGFEAKNLQMSLYF